MKKLNQHTQTTVTDYLDHFGLQEDPFAAKALPFFEGGSRRELFAELLHLCQFSTSILVVLGEEGVGKHSLKAALCQHFGDHDLICDLDLSVLGYSTALLESIAQQLVMGDIDSSDINQAIGVIRSRLQASEEDALKVVMVENAHHLSDDALTLLLRLAAPGDQHAHRQLHLVLFANPDFEQRLGGIDQTLVQCFTVDPLAISDIKHYLRFRLDAAGFSGIFPFNDSDLHFLWSISKGIPAKFHDAAREMLIEMALPPPENKSIGLPVTHMATVVVLLAGLLMIFFYWSDDQPSSVAVSNPTAEEQALLVTADLDTNPPLAEVPSKSVSNTSVPSITVPTKSPPSTNVSSLPSSDRSTAVPRQPSVPSPKQPPVVIEVSEQAVTAEEDIKALVAAAEQEFAQATPSPRPVPRPESQTSLTDDESALLDQSPKAFTLQVVAGSSRQAVDDFIRRQPNRDDLSVFTAKRNGKTLYIVVVGRFSSSDAARLAVGSLPSEQQSAGPWPRSLQSVQADIREFRGF